MLLIPFHCRDHGGPALGDILSFNGGYGVAGQRCAGHMVLRPNYAVHRTTATSTRPTSSRHDFQKGDQDIMTGVDHLIAQGMVDGSQMGVLLGCRRRRRWSNWTTTTSIASRRSQLGAGTSNWTSTTRRATSSRNPATGRDKLPYDDHDADWNQSLIKYIPQREDADDDPRRRGADPCVPKPQSVELHMALKSRRRADGALHGTRNTHGVPDARNQL